jgi:predicted transcriptional regulator
VKYHVGKEIQKQIKLSGISKSEIARRINKTRQNVEDILKRESIDSKLIFDISVALKHNFFDSYIHQLNKEIGNENSDLEVLRMEVEVLKKEILKIKEAISLLNVNK